MIKNLIKDKFDLLRVVVVGALYIASIITFRFVNVHVAVEFGVYFALYSAVGYETIIGAFKEFIEEPFNEEFLMLVASVGAFLLGEFAEAVAIMLFFAVGELFEDYAEERSEKAIEDLYGMMSDEATIADGDGIRVVDSKKVEIGDILLIRSGEKCAVDGVVTEGESFVDTSMITGESTPKRITVGDTIKSGYIVSGSPIKVRAEKRAEDSSAAKIIELIKEAQEKKAKSEKFITGFAKIYTPVVILLAVAVAFVPLIFGGKISVWGAKAINLLIISCPCALVVSVPIAFFSGIGKAFAHGMIVKGSAVIERASKTKFYAFDKTGTLTKGEFKVKNVFPKERADEILRIAASVERYSAHPIANAIVKAYDGKTYNAENVVERAGGGIVCYIDGEKVVVGNKRLIESECGKAVELDGEGTLVYVKKGDLTGLIEIGDEIKEGSYKLINELKSGGVGVAILTGDNEKSAADCAQKLGVNEYIGGLLPQDKLSALEKYKKNGKVCFVGDGINDSPVLAAADLAIAMGSGSDVAADCADVVIAGDDPYKITKLRKISGSTMRVVYENIVCSLSVKLAIFVLSLFGFVPMWLAVFGDVGVMILATINSFLLSRRKTF